MRTVLILVLLLAVDAATGMWLDWRTPAGGCVYQTHIVLHCN